MFDEIDRAAAQDLEEINRTSFRIACVGGMVVLGFLAVLVLVVKLVA